MLVSTRLSQIAPPNVLTWSKRILRMAEVS
jgi:hypothetical protein